MQAEHLVRQVDDSLVIEVVNEPTHRFGSPDHPARYRREEVLGDPKFEPSSRHGVISTVNGAFTASVIFGASGGASGVHEHSLAILENRGFLAVGPFLVCIELPSLTTRWVREVDAATCFGIHICPDRRSFVSHGELEISRLTLTGDTVWRSGGSDIFTGGLRLGTSAVLVEDFNGDTYSIDLETGDSVMKHRPADAR